MGKYIRLPQDMKESFRNEKVIKALPDFEDNLIGRIETERDKLNAEGEMVYSKSEIEVFNKCIKMDNGFISIADIQIAMCGIRRVISELKGENNG